MPTYLAPSLFWILLTAIYYWDIYLLMRFEEEYFGYRYCCDPVLISQAKKKHTGKFLIQDGRDVEARKKLEDPVGRGHLRKYSQ